MARFESDTLYQLVHWGEVFIWLMHTDKIKFTKSIDSVNIKPVSKMFFVLFLAFRSHTVRRKRPNRPFQFVSNAKWASEKWIQHVVRIRCRNKDNIHKYPNNIQLIFNLSSTNVRLSKITVVLVWMFVRCWYHYND